MDIWVELVGALWLLIPAYAANGWPPLARGKIPIDGGRMFYDGKRIFGDSKTVEGFTVGVAAGTFYGVIESYLYPSFNIYAGMWGASLPFMSPFVGFMIALGAMVGDLTGAFIKRRLGMLPGANAPVLDQLNFIVGAIIFSFAFTQISLFMAIIMLVLTPLIHRTVCIIGYALHFKKTPW
ncbi:MAG: CDP-2,3-bis-(O-geranylgeranyl)-sn-glycerol synthase [Candidatus Aenigmatarchaeota archaeon]|nr:CDP-2,3-bis-(O-geranylgeranyl)-sn-glycerol synthase [Candidatus Aenigmarchaeota archaeon]